MVEAEEEVRAMVTLYTIGCPKCAILEKKLAEADISYKVCEDTALMQEKGFDLMPMLEVDGKVMGFGEAVKWVNERSRRNED